VNRGTPTPPHQCGALIPIAAFEREKQKSENDGNDCAENKHSENL
jgi:hypothetical protein